MAVLIEKNQKYNLSKSLINLNNIKLKIDWQSSKNLDIDLSAFILNLNKTVILNSDFIYIGNKTFVNDSIKLNNEDLKVEIDLDKIPDEYFEISFVLNIHKSLERNYFLKDIDNLKLSIYDQDELILLYRILNNRLNNFDSIYFGSLMKRNDKWFFNADNKELLGGTKRFQEIYGLN